MFDTLIQAVALVACGVLWRVFRPFGLEADATRRVLSNLVYGLLLPALVLKVLWQASLGPHVLAVALLAAVAIVSGLAVAMLVYRGWRTPSAAAGALVLAAGFGNVSFLGLPVLESTLGPWAREVAIEYDLFASTPLLLTVGVLVAQRYGGLRGSESIFRSLLTVPPLWAAAVALLLNAADVPMASWLAGLLDKLAAGVTPLMLIVVGLGLAWQRGWARRLTQIGPLLVIKLLLVPLLVWALTPVLGLRGDWQAAVVLEAAMPSMVMGMVLCERYRLDSALYAEAVTVSTVAALVTLPMWLAVLR